MPNDIIMRPRPLSLTLRQHGFLYTQLSRIGRVALYEQSRCGAPLVRYEVIRIQVHQAHTWPTGETTPAHEGYPPATAWGRQGWTFFSRGAAEKGMQELVDQDQAFAQQRTWEMYFAGLDTHMESA
jgi:hypothetical protein